MGSLAATCLLPCLAIASAIAQQTEELAIVSGRAVDRDGKPVAGCAVGVFAKDEAFDTRALLARPVATTDVAGRYRVDARRDTDQIVVVATKGCQVCVLQLERDPGADRRVIDALMLPGGRLSGRVRNTNGKPIAGALVRVDDPLPVDSGEQTKMSFQSWGRTDERGIFEVLGVPRTGLRVTASAPGYPGVSRLAAHDSPLDLTLTITGLVHGRVVDAKGKPVPGRIIDLVTLERRDGAERVLSDGDGHFTITAPDAFGFLVVAYDSGPPYRSFTSGLLRGPADGVDVKQLDLQRDVQRITVRCVDAATKAPIADFHASLSPRLADQVAGAVLNHPQERQPFRGEATFDVGPWQRGRAFVVVDATGYGFATVAIPKECDGQLVAELPAACTLIGRVIDPKTGKPAGGCAVRALPDSKWHQFGGGPDPWRFGAVTDGEGRYRIGGLAPGEYDVQAYGVDRPSAFSTPIKVAPAAETTLDVQLEEPRFLELELVGDVPADCLASIWMDAIPCADGTQRGTAIHQLLPLPAPVHLTGTRKPKLGPVDDRQFHAKLLLPTRDRLGSALTIGLGVVAGNGPTRLQLPDLRTALHHGRVRLPADVAPWRVAVLANRRYEAGEGDGWARAMSALDRPFSACLGSDASFTIDVPQGRYVLQLVDLETGIVFHTDDAERTLDAATAHETVEITPSVRWLTIDFVSSTPDGTVVLQGIAVDARRPGDGLRAFVGPAGGDNNRQNMLVPWPTATSQLRWLVPAELKLTAVQSFHLLTPGNTHYERRELADAHVAPGTAEPHVTFRIPPPPASMR